MMVFNKKYGKKGMTIVELVVGMAAMLIVAEIIFGIWISTTRASDKSSSRILLYSEARLIEDQVFSILKKRIPDSEVVPPGSAPLSAFNSGEVKVFSPSPFASQYNINLITIKNKPSGDGKCSQVVLALQEYNKENGQLTDAGEKEIGSQSDSVSAKISFKFASEFKDLEPVFTDTAETSGSLKLLKYTIVLEDKNKNYSPVILSSAVAF